jgi:NhaP-type Na+/H+ or K+/H+ antiporter
VVPIAQAYWDTKAVLYALLILTVVRMFPVAVSPLGSAENWRTKLFIGWFEPRGIASILYLFMVLGDLRFAGFEYAISIIVLTVLLSIMLHSVSAVPLVGAHSRSNHKS